MKRKSIAKLALPKFRRLTGVKKPTKKHHLKPIDKNNNKKLSSQRVINENVIGMLKRFKIIADKYRNRRKRFDLRFSLIAGIYNYELA